MDISYISIKLLICFEGSWWAREMTQQLRALLTELAGKSSVPKIHTGCLTTMGNSYYHRGSNVLSYEPLQAHAHAHTCTCMHTLTAYIHTDTYTFINKNKNLIFFLKKVEVGNESNFKLVHSCLSMHQARCAPACARHWCVSMFSSPFQHNYPRTHKEHRKLLGRSYNNSAYGRGAEY